MRGRLAFLSSVRERTRGYILIPLEVKSGSPRTICPFPRRVLPFASGSLGALEIEARDRPSKRARENRERNLAAISFRFRLCFAFSFSRRFSRFAWIVRSSFVSATYFPLFYPLFMRFRLKVAFDESGNVMLAILTCLHQLNKSNKLYISAAPIFVWQAYPVSPVELLF